MKVQMIHALVIGKVKVDKIDSFVRKTFFTHGQL